MSTTPALIPVAEPDVEQRALDRARLLAGPDQYRLSADWLDAPGVFAMGEDNENHAGEHNADSLARACAVFPEAQWFTASVFDGVPSEVLRVTWARSEQMRDEIDRRRAVAFAQIRIPAG